MSASERSVTNLCLISKLAQHVNTQIQTFTCLPQSEVSWTCVPKRAWLYSVSDCTTQRKFNFSSVCLWGKAVRTFPHRFWHKTKSLEINEQSSVIVLHIFQNGVTSIRWRRWFVETSHTITATREPVKENSNQYVGLTDVFSPWYMLILASKIPEISG